MKPTKVGVINSNRLDNLTVFRGLTENQVQTLISYSNDVRDLAVRFNTLDWDDGKGRFASLANYQTWLQKRRTIYSLVSNNGELAGVIWFGEKPIPQLESLLVDRFDPQKYGITYAIRLYGSYRNAHLSKPFTKICYNDYQKTKQYQESPKKGIWVTVKEKNQPAISAYTRLGCKIISSFPVAGNIIMLFPENIAD